MSTAAAARLPWILSQWDLIDLQVDLRTRDLSSSLATEGVLRLRAGDTFRLAVLFFTGGGGAIEVEPATLKWALRDAANLELVSEVVATAPPAIIASDDPYYLLLPNIQALDNNAREMWGESGKDLACVMEVEYSIGGVVYSSRSLPARVDFGAGVTAGSGGGGNTGSPPPRQPPPLPPPQPPPPPGGGLTEQQARALFDQWLLEKLPIAEGFLYVKEGEFMAVPAGDCSTGEPWTPT
jgi:hypothetical protein